MFLPLHDKNPLRVVAFQIITVTIIIACTLVFLRQLSLDQSALTVFAYAWGSVPSVLFGNQTISMEIQSLPQPLMLISYPFLHSGWAHLLGNMLFLWVFGDNVEDSMGHFRFLVYYLCCGIGAALLHGLMLPDSQLPLIGASGAIAGILGGYLVLHPRVKILVLAFNRIPIRLPAYLLIALWLLLQLYQVLPGNSQSNVAWWAHIGGFLTGLILIAPMRYKSVPLFDKGVQH